MVNSIGPGRVSDIIDVANHVTPPTSAIQRKLLSCSIMRFYSDVMLKIHDLVFQNSFPHKYFIMPEVYLRITEGKASN
jgi:hypothetical protein